MMARMKLLVLALAVILGSVSANAVAGSDGTIGIASRSVAVGEQGTVTLDVADFPHLLGAWMIDIEYDPVTVQPVKCVAEYGGLCDLEHGETSLRVTSASAEGLTGDFSLASIGFTCESEGLSAVTIALPTWGVGTVGFPPPPPEILDGSITCVDPPVDASELPATGTGTSTGTAQGTSHWLIASLAFAGIMAISLTAVRRMLSNS